jgi:hypothetical protein
MAPRGPVWLCVAGTWPPEWPLWVVRGVRISSLSWSPVTESNRRPSPYHGTGERLHCPAEPVGHADQHLGLGHHQRGHNQERGRHHRRRAAAGPGMIGPGTPLSMPGQANHRAWPTVPGAQPGELAARLGRIEPRSDLDRAQELADGGTPDSRVGNPCREFGGSNCGRLLHLHQVDQILRQALPFLIASAEH